MNSIKTTPSKDNDIMTDLYVDVTMHSKNDIMTP
jgi:hypothetical protein